MVQPLWKTVWRFPKKFKIELPYDPAVALLGNYHKDKNVLRRRAICTPMFLAAMATIATLWKERRCPSKEKWIKKIWSTYTMEYYASIRKDEYPTFVSTWTGLEEIMLHEISGESQLSYDLTYVWSIRKI